jgi:hypothetical protein
LAGPAQGQHFYTFSKEGKQNETYTRHTRVVWLGRFARGRNDHSLDTDSQRNNKDHVIPGSRVIEHFPFPLGPGPGGFYFLKRRKTGRKAQDLTKLRDRPQDFLLVVWLWCGILRLLTITKGKQIETRCYIQGT